MPSDAQHVQCRYQQRVATGRLVLAQHKVYLLCILEQPQFAPDSCMSSARAENRQHCARMERMSLRCLLLRPLLSRWRYSTFCKRSSLRSARTVLLRPSPGSCGAHCIFDLRHSLTVAVDAAAVSGSAAVDAARRGHWYRSRTRAVLPRRMCYVCWLLPGRVPDGRVCYNMKKINKRIKIQNKALQIDNVKCKQSCNVNTQFHL